VRKKPRNVPVFLIYAGVVHAIGLALLLPMLITLPGPGSEIATESAAIDVEIIPASPLAGKIGGEQTSALPAATVDEDAGVGAGAAETADPVDPDAKPDQDENAVPQQGPEKADLSKQKTKAEAARPPRTSAAKPAKKAAAPRKSVRVAARKKDPKIVPFDGALSGLFSPGAPAKRR
jgi:hypothetical protein